MHPRTLVGLGSAAGLLAAAMIAASLVGARAHESAPPRGTHRGSTALLDGIPQQGAALGRPDAPGLLKIGNPPGTMSQ